MELTPLRYFQAIARHQHLTRAARELGVTQPALSAMLKKLEKHVGTPLVHRSGRGVALTEPGKAFLAHAEEAIRRAEAREKRHASPAAAAGVW
jgi:DNA-binding transcriptional LysR family regulator